MSLMHPDGGACACPWMCLGIEDTAEHGLTDAEMCNLFIAFAMLRTGAQLVRGSPVQSGVHATVTTRARRW